MGKPKGGRRGAHSSYRTLSMEKPKNAALHHTGKQAGKRFSKRGPEPVGKGKRARFY